MRQYWPRRRQTASAWPGCPCPWTPTRRSSSFPSIATGSTRGTCGWTGRTSSKTCESGCTGGPGRLMSDLTRRAVATDYGFMALGNERLEADGATFIRNASVALIRDANQVIRVTAATPRAVDGLLAPADRDYA